jgi:hypothetical protein
VYEMSRGSGILCLSASVRIFTSFSGLATHLPPVSVCHELQVPSESFARTRKATMRAFANSAKGVSL